MGIKETWDNLLGNGDDEPVGGKPSVNKANTSQTAILIQPRAYSESQQIVDHLKSDRPVIVNMRRITAEQAKRVLDFITGAVYALEGKTSKVGSGIFLCTPRSMGVEGSIEEYGSKEHKEDDLSVEFD